MSKKIVGSVEVPVSKFGRVTKTSITIPGDFTGLENCALWKTTLQKVEKLLLKSGLMRP